MVAIVNKTYTNYTYVIRCAVADGRLMKPENCSQCGDGGKINAHHDDYNKPLDVIWLCNRCHTRLHYGIPFDAPMKTPAKPRSDPCFRDQLWVGDKLIRLPVLRNNPSVTAGLVSEDGVVDEHNYFEENVNWTQILMSLPYREFRVIKLRYGIDCDHAYTLLEIARMLKVTRERVRQMEASAIMKLRHPLRLKILQEMIDK